MKNKINIVLAAVMCFVVADSAHAAIYTVVKPSINDLTTLYNNTKPKIQTYINSNPSLQPLVNSITDQYQTFVVNNPTTISDLTAAKDQIVTLYDNAPTTYTVKI